RQLFHWRELLDQPLITFESGSPVRELLDQRLGEHGVQPAVVMELRAIASIATMVATGIGLGFVSRFTPEAERGLRCADGAVRRQLALIERRDRVRSPALDAFCAALLDERSTWTWSTQSPE
ncbi:MAG: LysR family transcriptional regulator substrate-binding protein, partial [Planctomycetota bacterium]|nr:LysR family transcriptional regulator substrate-binding protein [Planctomycetota bacterium]